jgi:hypothetical protein
MVGAQKNSPPNQTDLKYQPKTKTQTQNKPKKGKSTDKPNPTKQKN